MKIYSKWIAVFMVVILYLNLFSITVNASTTDNYTIYINTVEDLTLLQEKCTLDIYSQDKIVILNKDIDLSGYDFTPIPSFGGVFKGNNHTISGLVIDETGSNQGFFRYIQVKGVVMNLNVIGTVIPNGTKNNIGGITGNNAGKIQNCTFTGDVIGDTNVGGIAGINDSTGYIADSSSAGTVVGEHFTGGIVGQNLGAIMSSTNISFVNTTSKEIPFEIDDIKWNQLNSTENLDTYTDTGGIAGLNTGIMQYCENKGNIGYSHVGYNIGGIAGRQSGYINDCTNYGKIYGRKDVGGIVGQMEPYQIIKFSKDTLEKLEVEMEKLETNIKTTIDDIDTSSEQINNQLATLINLTEDANDELNTLINKTTDYADETIDNINTVSDRIHRILGQLNPVLTSFGDATDTMTSGFKQLEEGFYELETASDSFNSGLEDINDVFYDLNKAAKDTKNAFDKIAKASYLLDTAVDSEALVEALDEIKAGLNELEEAVNAGTEAMIIIGDAFSNLDNPLSTDWDILGQQLKEQGLIIQESINSATPQIRNGINMLTEEIEKDTQTINVALSIIQDSFKDLAKAMEHVSDSYNDIQDAIDNLQSTSSALTRAFEKIGDSMGTFSEASDYMTKGIRELESIVEEAAKEPTIKFPKLGESINEANENLFDTLEEISTEMIDFNKISSNASNSFLNNIRAINDQVWIIVSIIQDARKAIALDDDSIFEDISDTEFTNKNTNTEGHVNKCFNYGSIHGDVDVGGITGSIAIEYDFDPEDDVTDKGNPSIQFQYQTKAVVRNSVNNGKVTAKKDFSGGIVGRMDLGLIFICENYGYISSTDGNYVGGVAGNSSTTIRNSYSMSRLSGLNFIGGIAGNGTNIYDCYAIVDITKGIENIGAIAGSVEGEVINNFFVKEGWAGIDSISYENKATPQDYDTFILAESIPDKFKEFKLTFMADNKEVETIVFNYGDFLSIDELPKIPEKEGYYSKWPDYNYKRLIFSDTLEAIYTPMIKVLSTDETPLPLLLVEGAFVPNTKLNIKPSQINPFVSTDGQEVLGQWNISVSDISNDLSEPLTYRFLAPEQKENVSLWQFSNGEWKQLDIIVDGSYLVFKSINSTMDITATGTVYNYIYMKYGIIGLVIIILIIIVINKNFKQRKNI